MQLASGDKERTLTNSRRKMKFARRISIESAGEEAYYRYEPIRCFSLVADAIEPMERVDRDRSLDRHNYA